MNVASHTAIRVIPTGWYDCGDGMLFRETFDGTRTRVLREPPGESPWEMWVRRPPPPLAGYVSALWAGDAEASYARHRMLPNGELMVTVNLGTPQRLVEGGGAGCGEVYRSAWISGLQESPLTVESMVRHPRAVAINLRPLGAWTLFGGLPLRELTNEMIDLESVVGGTVGIASIRERMIEATDLGAALDVLEAWLVERVGRGPAAHPTTHAALQRVLGCGGDVRVAHIARELGVSSRYLNELFHRQVGVPAKTMARIVRVGRALEGIAAGKGADLVGLALDCGYFDQSHLNRDFRELTGQTPTEYAASLVGALHDPYGVPG